MSQQFKIGDLVTLKSGGPRMTVAGVGDYLGAGEIEVQCIWFDGGKRQTETFPPETLQPL